MTLAPSAADTAVHGRGWLQLILRMDSRRNVWKSVAVPLRVLRSAARESRRIRCGRAGRRGRDGAPRAAGAQGIGTESLYEEICERYDGTLDDPIPYDGNMTLEAGKYYYQNDMLYRCTRDTGQAVHHALRDLVGLYVEAV